MCQSKLISLSLSFAIFLLYFRILLCLTEWFWFLPSSSLAVAVTATACLGLTDKLDRLTNNTHINNAYIFAVRAYRFYTMENYRMRLYSCTIQWLPMDNSVCNPHQREMFRISCIRRTL